MMKTFKQSSEKKVKAVLSVHMLPKHYNWNVPDYFCLIIHYSNIHYPDNDISRFNMIWLSLNVSNVCHQ